MCVGALLSADRSASADNGRLLPLGSIQRLLRIDTLYRPLVRNGKLALTLEIQRHVDPSE